MANNIDLKFNTIKIIGSIVFIFIFFPYITHIYSAIFPAVYDFDIKNITLILIFITTINIVSRQITSVSKDIIFFCPLILSVLLYLIIESQYEILKYAAYIYIYFFLVRDRFIEKYYFNLYANLIVFLTLILLFIFLYANLYITENEYLASIGNDVVFFSDQSPMTFAKHRSIVGNLLVFDMYDKTGIFNFPRFYGFSREPAFFALFLVPSLFISLYYGKKFNIAVLVLAILLNSSFTAFAALGIFLFFLYFTKRKFLSAGVLITLAVFILLNVLSKFDIKRVNDYIGLFFIGFDIFSEKFFNPTLENFLYFFKNISILTVFYLFLKKTELIDNKLIYGFVIATIILVIKSNEYLPPLLFFYFSFIELAMKDKENNKVA